MIENVIDLTKPPKEEEPTFAASVLNSKLMPLFLKLNPAYRITMFETSVNTAFRAVLDARKSQLIADLLNITTDDYKLHWQRYNINRLELCFIDDILAFLNEVKADLETMQKQA